MVNDFGLINVYQHAVFLIALCIREKYVANPPKKPKSTVFFSMNLLQVKGARERYRIPSWKQTSVPPIIKTSSLPREITFDT